MIRYRVTCQDAVGNSVDIDVRATSDELACATALRELNTWRAVKALPAIGLLAADALTVPAVEKVATIPRAHVAHRQQAEAVSLAESPETGGGGNERGVRAPVPSSPHIVGVRIVHKAGPTDWVKDYLLRGGNKTAVGRALAEAVK